MLTSSFEKNHIIVEQKKRYQNDLDLTWNCKSISHHGSSIFFLFSYSPSSTKWIDSGEKNEKSLCFRRIFCTVSYFRIDGQDEVEFLHAHPGRTAGEPHLQPDLRDGHLVDGEDIWKRPPVPVGQGAIYYAGQKLCQANGTNRHQSLVNFSNGMKYFQF
jgi:hypothetical protein